MPSCHAPSHSTDHTVVTWVEGLLRHPLSVPGSCPELSTEEVCARKPGKQIQTRGSPGKVGRQDGTVTLPHTLERGWAHFLWANPPKGAFA